MRAVTGVVPVAINACLENFVCYQLCGVDYPAIIPQAGAMVQGTLYTGIGAGELRSIDQYESYEYNRIRVRVKDSEGSWHVAWSYVLSPAHYRRIKRQSWSPDAFAKYQIEKYICRHGWR